MRKIAIAGLVACALCTAPAAAQRLPSIGGIVRDVIDEAADSATSEAIAGAAVEGELANTWRSSTRSRFHHVLEAAPGRHRLTIQATTTSPGGETVAVYPQTAGGERGGVRIGFVIATRAGSSEEMFVTIPQPPEGEATASLPIIVDVENASGREYSGNYSLTLAPA
jgi:hypothetical protein